jgi:hypothetical protein
MKLKVNCSKFILRIEISRNSNSSQNQQRFISLLKFKFFNHLFHNTNIRKIKKKNCQKKCQNSSKAKSDFGMFSFNFLSIKKITL